MALYQWSTTPASNATAGSINWAEGQAPSTVNDSARQLMADVATYMVDPQFYNYGDTPTYVSTVSFTVPGNQTANYTANRRLKATVTAGTVYATISTSAYTTLTTVTVVMDSGVLDSGLSKVELGTLTPSNNALPGVLNAIAAQTTAANKVQAYSGLNTPTLLTTGTASGNIPLVGTKSATTSLAGLAQLATQAQAEAATDNTTVLTPLSGGQAIAKLGLGGSAQAWTDVSASRVSGTVYQNTSGKPIFIMLGTSGATSSATLLVGSANPPTLQMYESAASYVTGLSFIVPNGWYYKVTITGSVNYWTELS